MRDTDSASRLIVILPTDPPRGRAPSWEESAGPPPGPHFRSSIRAFPRGMLLGAGKCNPAHHPVFPRCSGLRLTLCANSAIEIRDIAVLGWARDGGRDG